MKTVWTSNYFCGNKISDYGIEHKRVDYATLAKSFDCVLANDLMNKTADIGYWDIYSGDDRYYEIDGETYTEAERLEKLEDLREVLESLEDEEAEDYKAIEERIEEFENADENYYDFFQFYIISDAGARILSDYTNETVWYNEELDLYVWGITHYGTSWDYVLTDIVIDTSADNC